MMCVKEVRRVSSWVMYLKFSIRRECWSMISIYAPGMERTKERERFWKELK